MNATAPDFAGRVRELYAAGLTTARVAAALGVSPTRVNRTRRALGVPPTGRPGGRVHDHDRAVAMARAGRPVAAIAAACGCTRQNVAYVLTRAGVPYRDWRRNQPLGRTALRRHVALGRGPAEIAAAEGCPVGVVTAALGRAGLADARGLARVLAELGLPGWLSRKQVNVVTALVNGPLRLADLAAACGYAQTQALKKNDMGPAARRPLDELEAGGLVAVLRGAGPNGAHVVCLTAHALDRLAGGPHP